MVPLWVSRKDADGMIYTFSVSGLVFTLIALLLTLNVVAWGIIGLVEVVQYIF